TVEGPNGATVLPSRFQHADAAAPPEPNGFCADGVSNTFVHNVARSALNLTGAEAALAAEAAGAPAAITSPAEPTRPATEINGRRMVVVPPFPPRLITREC